MPAGKNMEATRPFVRANDLRDTIIYDIVDLEWNMYTQMKADQGTPADPDGYEAFYQVRYSQHSAMNSDTLGMYRSDLNTAMHTGRNLMKEKYDYMRSPETFAVDPEIKDLVEEAAVAMKASHEKFAASYPALAQAGHALDAEEGTVSIDVYIRSELVNRTDTVLQMLARDVRLNPDYVQDIFATFVSFFDQDSLDQAEVLAASRTMQPCRGGTA